jgi:hypothetical protein
MNNTGTHSGNFVANRDPGIVAYKLLVSLDLKGGCSLADALMKKGLRLITSVC